MKYHIVSSDETLADILFIYDLTEDELKKENRHIRMWNRLVPGTKLKIPMISEANNLDIDEIEPFIEDYYPKLKIDVDYEQNQEIIEDEIVINPLETMNNGYPEEKNYNNQEIIEEISQKQVIEELQSKQTEAATQLNEKPKVDYEKINTWQKNAQPRVILPYYPYPVYPYPMRPVIYVVRNYKNQQ